jgi:hypothetical protein
MLFWLGEQRGENGRGLALIANAGFDLTRGALGIVGGCVQV